MVGTDFHEERYLKIICSSIFWNIISHHWYWFAYRVFSITFWRSRRDNLKFILERNFLAGFLQFSNIQALNILAILVRVEDWAAGYLHRGRRVSYNIFDPIMTKNGIESAILDNVGKFEKLDKNCFWRKESNILWPLKNRNRNKFCQSTRYLGNFLMHGRLE